MLEYVQATTNDRRKCAVDPEFVVAVVNRGSVDNKPRVGLRMEGHPDPLVVEGEYEEILAEIVEAKSMAKGTVLTTPRIQT